MALTTRQIAIGCFLQCKWPNATKRENLKSVTVQLEIDDRFVVKPNITQRQVYSSEIKEWITVATHKNSALAERAASTKEG